MEINILQLHEALASTALTHPDECGCYICRAATGDIAAIERVIEDLNHLNAEEENDSTIPDAA